MTDLVWVISSSVLILMVMEIRAIFGKRMSAGLRYALWGIVALRLLIPGTFFASPVSVETALSNAPVVSDLESLKGISSVEMNEDGMVTGRTASFNAPKPWEPAASGSAAHRYDRVLERGATAERFESIKRTVKARDVLNVVWYCGMGALGLWFAFVNLHAYFDLRKKRERLEVDAPCRIYAVEGISSSCLFMGSVYVTKQAAEDEQTLKFVLAHELAHRRHGDGVIVLLRAAPLILHWYNPLVWAAAYLSRCDGEIFADAGAIDSLGEGERESYGLALIGLSSKLKKRVALALAATSMTGGKRELKERIANIAKSKRTKLIVAVIVGLLLLTAVGCTFLGMRRNDEYSSGPSEVFTYFIDADHDGEAEEFEVDLKKLTSASFASARIVKNGKTLCLFEELGTSHAGMMSFAHTELDGKDYILLYEPYLGGGTFSMFYQLLEVKDGELAVKEQDSFLIELGYSGNTNFDPERGAALIERVNELWKSSKLIISTDAFTLMHSGLYNISDGAPYDTRGAAVIAYSDHLLYTPEEGPKVMSFSTPVSYEEKLTIIDDFFADNGEYDPASAIAEKLAFISRNIPDHPVGEWYVDQTEESGYYEYMGAAADLLAGEGLHEAYSCDVYFRLDDDALRAYARRDLLERRTQDGDYEGSYDYEHPIAEYPREVGERALIRLYGEIAWDGLFTGPYTGAEGFIGDDWFVLKTIDDSMQDIQFSCIYRWNGNEWYEFGDNNSQQERPLFGACIVDENVGFLSYFTKFYDEPDGTYRKLWFYRTDDGGKTWVDMGLEIPEEYGFCYPGFACSPVFDGDHGVMQVLAYANDPNAEGSDSYGFWYETNDGGVTWILHGGKN